jgi:uncharacterized membrane protein YkoI
MLKPSVSCVALGIAAVLVGGAASAAEPIAFTSKVGLEKCLLAALAAKPGQVVKLEAKLEKGAPVYEFDIVGADGRAWDVECNANTGKITEIEEEVANADAAAFKAKVKVNEADARKIALDAYPGEIIETEYEIESDGAASYEFDIRTKDGKEWKVEVDATTGKIVEANREYFQIGKE